LIFFINIQYIRIFKSELHRFLNGAFVYGASRSAWNVVLALSVVILFLLVVGLPLVRGINTKKNLKRHGILATFALTLQTILFLVMLPSFVKNFVSIIALSPLYEVNTWLHFTLGSVAIVSGDAYVGLWLINYRSGLMCARGKKFMLQR
jgi:hypothetical protein